MVVPKETLTDLKEKYEKAYQFVDEESQNDPHSEPYRSHYAARDILTTVMENLKNSIDSEPDETDNQLTYKIILAYVYRDLGRISVFCDETELGEKYLHNTLELIELHYLKPECIIAFVGCLNELGIVWGNRENHKESFNYLERAQQAYNDFKKTELKPLTINDIFGTVDEIEDGKGYQELEKLYTLTTFYLAQVLGFLGKLDVSAQYCNTTLRRQIEAKNYDSIDWALNAATLSQYYIGVNRFTEARHHLAAATNIMDEFEPKMITDTMTEDKKKAVKENFQHRYADVSRCWAKYGLALLVASKEHLMADDDQVIVKDMEKVTVSSYEYRFESLSLSAYESRVIDQFCLTFDDAKLIFCFVLQWLDIAQEYYKAETEASEYAKIITDYADLYKNLAFFEEIPANQSKMHKKRVDYYEELLKLLNPKYYLTICRECWYNCGLSHCSMLDIKLDAIEQLNYNESPSPHALHKINLLCDKAIKNFKDFIDSYIDKETNNINKNITKDEKQVVLFSYFHLGRLFYKIITPNKEMQLNNLTNSLKYYKIFVEGCEEDPEASSNLHGEIGVCKEMISLLPLKIQKTINEIKDENH